MPSTLPAVPAAISLALPPAITELGDAAAHAFVEYFTAQLRNPNTRSAYARAVVRFLDWIGAHGLGLPQVEPVHVAAYVEELGRPRAEGGAGYATATVKQHLSALKMLGTFLVIKQVLPTNPANLVRSPRHVVRQGKTPVLEAEDARALFDSIDLHTPVGLRDLALLHTMVYTFARVSAVLALDVGDYYQAGRRMLFRFQEKGGRHHEMPAHHRLTESMDAYLEVLDVDAGPLFRSVNPKRDAFTTRRLDRRTVLTMIKRRTRAAGLGERFGAHSLRATGITAYLKNGGTLEQAQHMAAHASPRTTKLYDRRLEEVTLDEVQRIRF